MIFEASSSEDIPLLQTEHIVLDHLIFAYTFILNLSCYKILMSYQAQKSSRKVFV